MSLPSSEFLNHFFGSVSLDPKLLSRSIPSVKCYALLEYRDYT